MFVITVLGIDQGLVPNQSAEAVEIEILGSIFGEVSGLIVPPYRSGLVHAELSSTPNSEIRVTGIVEHCFSRPCDAPLLRQQLAAVLAKTVNHLVAPALRAAHAVRELEVHIMGLHPHEDEVVHLTLPYSE